jgi:hypothetical protein
VIIYCHSITPRLRYIVDFIGAGISKTPFTLTTDIEKFRQYTGDKFNYSDQRISENEFFLKPHSLLFEKNIQRQQTDCFEVNDQNAFFRTEGDLSFDIFAASFYLLSRYEEYLPHKKDTYGRYAHENSLAVKENFLHLPLINLWLEGFKKVLKQKFPSFPIPDSQFQFLPTYDIDQAWSYLHKSWWRNWGGLLRSMVNGQWSMIKDRRKVLLHKKPDPFDCYDWVDELHNNYGLKPTYFFHVAEEASGYDKNISPGDPHMQELIRQHAEKYTIGVHPSWQSGDKPSLISKEIQTLEQVSGKKIQTSRQHYIRFTLPETFRLLIRAGIKKDYSMGYGSINGFRASVASPFYWYDLEKEEKTNLELYPFCFMDANSFFEQKFSAQQALDEMRHYRNIIQSVNGMMISIWHNNFLGTDQLFAGWKEVYEQFIKELS